ncbi:uncharacterized protein LOC124706505 isoform X2 [Lolium rigidum]|nr:uncharacterized protein LOC124706505 isoform X2 [Lolium rigidum]XP_047094126.1 uncharacterized protein LOC124706505 isoform X2 [Lolium rigidum]
MAILVSCVPTRASALHTPGVSRRQTSTGSISVSARRRRIPVGLTTESWGISCVPPITRATPIAAVDSGVGEPPAGGKFPAVDPGAGEPPAGGKTSAVDPVPGEPPARGKFSLPNIPSWVKLVVGAYFAAVPFYWQMRAMEERVEEAAEEAMEAVERVAETAEKIAEDVAEAFPENKSLKKAASRIKAITYEVEEDANKAEALLHKLIQEPESRQQEENSQQLIQELENRQREGKPQQLTQYPENSQHEGNFPYPTYLHG